MVIIQQLSFGEDISPEQFELIYELIYLRILILPSSLFLPHQCLNHLRRLLFIIHTHPMGVPDSWNSKIENACPNRFLSQRIFLAKKIILF
jgi:hypothetical protein